MSTVRHLAAIVFILVASITPARSETVEVTGAEIEAYAYFSLTITAAAQGNDAAARQAATIGMNAVMTAVAGGSNDTGVLLGIYASLDGFLSEGTLNYQGGEFDNEGVWLADSAGMTYFATYEQFGALLTQALTSPSIVFDVTFDHDAWEVYGPGEQPGDSGVSDGGDSSTSYQGALGQDYSGSDKRLRFDDYAW